MYLNGSGANPSALVRWKQVITQEDHFAPNAYEGVRPVACDLTAFFRPQLQRLASKHYLSDAGKALPAVVFGLCVTAGKVRQKQEVRQKSNKKRLGLLRLIVRQQDSKSEVSRLY